MEETFSDEFGFLSEKISVSFGGYVIRQKASINEDLQYLRTLADSEEIVYPAPESTSSSIPSGGYERRCDRPGTIIQVLRGNSHTISKANGDPLPENFRRWDGEFALGMLSLFYRTSLQFKGWFHDRGMPLKSSGIAIIRNGDGLDSRDQLSELFSSTFEKWITLGASAQENVLNAFYFHSRAPFYKRGYERFFVEYMVIDAIWKAGITIGLWTDNSRKIMLGKEWPYKQNKLIYMIDKMEMYDPDRYFGGAREDSEYCKELMSRTNSIYKVRNDLFHEGRWDSNNRMSLAFENLMVYRMHNFTNRLILAFLGIRNSHTRLWWWGHAMTVWD